MIVTLEGKQHKEGISKKGNNYSFSVIHFLAPKSGVDGRAAYEKILSDTVANFEALKVGSSYDLTVGFDGSIEHLKEVRS